MRNLKIQVLLIFTILFFVGITFTECRKKYPVESAAIDSLASKNRKAREYLRIDLITIEARKKEMNGQIAVLKSLDNLEAEGDEFLLNFNKYKGIAKIYTRFIENYDVIYNRVSFNEKQLSDLKNSLVDNKINGSDFKQALGKINDGVIDNLANAETFGNKIFQLEPDYQKLSAFYTPMVDALAKKYPKLDSLYSQNFK